MREPLWGEAPPTIPTGPFAESLLRAASAGGSIVVYSSYEGTRLRELEALFPDLVPRLARHRGHARVVQIATVSPAAASGAPGLFFQPSTMASAGGVRSVHTQQAARNLTC
jgi:hypothetical protein